MAKTTSQIVAENKQRRAEEKAMRQARGDVRLNDAQRKQAMQGASKESKTQGIGASIAKSLTKAMTSQSGTSSGNQTAKRTGLPGFEGSQKPSPRDRAALAKEKQMDFTPGSDSRKIKAEAAERAAQAEYKRYQNQEPLGTGKYTEKGIPRDQAEYLAEQEWYRDKKQSYLDQGIPERYAEALTNQAKGEYDQEKKAYDEGLNKRYEAKADAESLAEGQRNLAHNRGVTETNLNDIAAMTPEERAYFDGYLKAKDQYYHSASEIPEDRLAYKNQMEEYARRLSGKYDANRLKELEETLSWLEDEKTTQEVAEQAAALGHAGGLKEGAAYAGTFPAKLAGSVTGTVGTLNSLLSGTGQYKGANPYNTGNLLNVYGDAVRGAIAEDIQGDGDSKLRKAAGYGFQAFNSAADSLLRAAVGGKASLALSASASFNDTVLDAAQKGASTEEAVMLGLLNAGIETATEKIPLDNLLETMTSDPKTGWELLRAAVVQGGIEASTEELSLLGTTLAETAVLRERSDYKMNIRELMADGKTEAEAREIADKQLWEEAKDTLIVSWLSGSASNLGGNVYAGVNEKIQDQRSLDAYIAEDAIRRAAEEQAKKEALAARDEFARKYYDQEQLRAEEATRAAAAAAAEAEANKLRVSGNVELEAPEDFARNFFSYKDNDFTEKDVKKINKAWAAEQAKTANGQEGELSFLQDAVDGLQGQKTTQDAQTPGGLTQEDIDQLGAQLARQELPAEIPPMEALDGGQVQDLADQVLGVDNGTEQNYNKNGRSPQTTDAINRLNAGGEGTPAIEEIMALPEIAEAENANIGTETFQLPDRDSIRANGYQQAIQKGSWDGRDYTGPVKQERRMDIVIGLPGSGKSSVYTERLSQEHQSRVIDTDDFREYIPEYNGRNAALVHEEASSIKDSVMETALDNGDNILLSTIGANAKSLEAKIKAYKEEGYLVYLHLNELPNNKSVARAIGRYVGEDGTLGRYVAPDLIAGYGDKPTQTYLYLTGQGGNANGETGGLAGNLRESGADGTGNAGTSESQTGSQAEGGSLLAGYDWYNNDVQRGQPPRLIQSSEKLSAPQADTGNVSTEGGQPDSGWRYQRDVAPGVERDSQSVMNTALHNGDKDVRNATRETLQQNPDAAKYTSRSMGSVEAAARNNVSTPEAVEYSYNHLMDSGHWNDVDVATANLLLQEFAKAKDSEAFNTMLEARKQRLKDMGEAINATKIGTMGAIKDTVTAISSFQTQLDGLDQKEATFGKGLNKEGFEAKKKEIKDSITKIGFEIEDVADGDTEAMRGIIRQLAKKRGTTAWFGLSNKMGGNVEKMMSTMKFSDLRMLANAQIISMADDFRVRSAAETAQAVRIQSMLSSLKTFSRNLTGNAASGGISSLSDSTGGQLFDFFISKATGKRTVGNDVTRMGTYLKGAKNAMDFASLCVELNIPIESDIQGLETAFDGKNGNKYIGKAFRSNSKNPVQRLMYAYQKYMSYALEVSDKIFEGGTNAVIEESLGKLRSSGLSDQEVSDIAEYEANRRTFKDATWEDEDGKEHGATLSRKANEVKKVLGPVGDVVMPFASVPMNVAQTGIDYSPVGFVNGLYETATILKDIRAGKEINAVRQHKAATDLGRGMTGTAMVAMFAAAANAGILKVSDDEDRDKKGLEQSEGLSGAKLNLSAWKRAFAGEGTEWQEGDIIMGMDFLEPFNTQMYLGSQLAEDETISEILWDATSVPAAFNAIMDSPMMTGISEIEDLVKEARDSESGTDMLDAGAEYAGDVAGSFIPQFVRQGAQLKDGYYRDTRGQTAAETALNNIKSGIPGLSETLPKKVNGLGEEQERPGFVGTFLDPTNTHRYHPNEITRELEKLSEETDDKGIYPSRQAPMSIKNGDEEIQLTGEQREEYQKIYGEKVSDYYGALMKGSGYQNMTSEEKVAAMKKAEGYAKEHAKDWALGYKSSIVGTPGEIANSIIRDTTLSSITNIFGDIDKNNQKGVSNGENVGDLGEAYKRIQGLPKAQREKVLERATGDARKYFDAKDDGVSDADFVKARNAIKNAPGTGSIDKQTGEKRQTDADTYGAIAGLSGVDYRTKDALLRAYMPDYDPANGKTEKTEVKYDYIRYEMGLTAQGYAALYKANSQYSKKADKVAAFQALGYDEKTADQLYRIFSGNQKTMETVLEWYKSR